MHQQPGIPRPFHSGEHPKHKKYRVFISHVVKDYPKAKQIQTALENVGIEVFMFEGNIPTGEKFAKEIRDELRNCDEVCLIWTKNSMKSKWVLFETGGAHALGRHISPILDEDLSSSDLPEALRLCQWCRVFEGPKYAKDVQERAENSELAYQPADSELRRLISGQDSKGDWQVIAHCDDKKWKKAGFPHAPGRELLQGLSTYAPQVHIAVLGETGKDEEDVTAIDSLVRCYADAVFLLDSPRSNPLVQHIFATYRQWVSFGNIRFECKIDRTSGFKYEQIVVHDTTTFLSDKYLSARTRECLVGPYKDYFVVLRLPGITLGMDSPDAKVWVLCGIHANGTWAAVRLFEGINLQQFVATMSLDLPGHTIPDYFEAVYEVPDHLDVTEEQMDLSSLNPVYFMELLSRDREIITDVMDARMLPLFQSDSERVKIPIQIAHIDPVAGCNFACSGCIEDDLRSRNLHLSLARCISILCSLKQCGRRKVGFYGGEPTLHPDFPCMLRVASEMGFEISLVTNGSRLHMRDLQQAIVDSPTCPQLRISIDADKEDTHARVHGKSPDTTLSKIKKAVLKLIKRGVYVSISYRLVPNSSDIESSEGNIFEAWDSCRFWKEQGARQFALRPMTKAGGEQPLLLSEGERLVIDRIEKDKALAGFVSAPDWLLELAATGSVAAQSKEYRTCYSAFYRVVISPEQQKSQDAVGSRPRASSETDKAWLSLCSYHRLDRAFGVMFPDDLAQWMEVQRKVDIERIDTHKQCANVLCCRHSYNQKVHEYLASCNT